MARQAVVQSVCNNTRREKEYQGGRVSGAEGQRRGIRGVRHYDTIKWRGCTRAGTTQPETTEPGTTALSTLTKLRLRIHFVRAPNNAAGHVVPVLLIDPTKTFSAGMLS